MELIRHTAPRLYETLNRDAYVRDWVLPRGASDRSFTIYVPKNFFGNHGLEMRLDEQIERTEKWRNEYDALFETLRNDPRINTQYLGSGFLHNGYYCTPDAEIYACMIADNHPTDIVEVGGGFSTLIASKVCRSLQLETRITVVDPEPRTGVTSASHFVISKLIEEVDLNELPLGKGAFLFIDSSHVARAGGDVPYIYNKLLPQLPTGTLVHVHDIYIPYDYPAVCQKFLYTEQYVLQALLAHSQRYRVVYASHFMTRTCPKLMQSVFGNIVGNDELFYGGAFWFRVE